MSREEITSIEITVSCNISPSAPGNPVALVKMCNRVSYLDRKYYNYVLIESYGIEGNRVSYFDRKYYNYVQELMTRYRLLVMC